MTVPANSLSTNFTITTTEVGAVTKPNISGSYNGSAQTGFTVNPGSLISQTGWSLLSVDSQETRFHVLPRLSLRPLMLTGRPFQGVLVETKATRVEVPVELKAVDVCTVSGVPFYVAVAGHDVDTCANAGRIADIVIKRIAKQ